MGDATDDHLHLLGDQETRMVCMSSFASFRRSGDEDTSFEDLASMFEGYEGEFGEMMDNAYSADAYNSDFDDIASQWTESRPRMTPDYTQALPFSLTLTLTLTLTRTETQPPHSVG